MNHMVTTERRDLVSQLAKFPIKKESKELKLSKLSTYDRRMVDIKKLDGKYNGWWIYQFCMGEYGNMTNKNRRR